MSNVLVSVRFTVNVSGERLADLVGRPDDDSEAWFHQASNRAEQWVKDNLPDALELTIDEPDVEA